MRVRMLRAIRQVTVHRQGGYLGMHSELCDPMINGPECSVRTLVQCGIEVFFSNSNTSQMHFVGALDRIDGIRPVLGLFEGVVTGAADGYARMAGSRRSPCSTSGRAWAMANGPAGLPIVGAVPPHEDAPGRAGASGG
jgi:hypothetical protein